MNEVEELFAKAFEGLEATNASAGDRAIVMKLQRHGQEEGALLSRYRRFAEESASPAVRYLVRMIIDDEQRHHRQLAEFANAIAWGWSGNSPVTATPETVGAGDARDPALAAETKELIAVERRDQREIRRLQKDLGDYEKTTLWTLLTQLMLRDSDKHEHILRFIVRELT